MSEETKSLISSKTFWGVMLAILGAFAPKFGLTFDEQSLAALADELVILTGGALAVYGRVKAAKSVDRVL